MGAGFGVLVVIGGVWWLRKFLIKRRMTKRKKKFFKRNGGLLLQQELNTQGGNVEKTESSAQRSWRKPPKTSAKTEFLDKGVKVLCTKVCS